MLMQDAPESRMAEGSAFRRMFPKRNPMEPAVLALASNESYFPGLYCAVASVFSHLDAHREVDLKVLDGGISQKSRDTLSRLIDSVGGLLRLAFVLMIPS